MRRAVKRVFLLGVIAGVGYAIWRAVQARLAPASGGIEWDTAPFPFPPVPRPPAAVEPASAPSSNDAARWIEPNNGACPATHPVKAKLSSGIFHVPGGQNYERTHADRCYVDPEAAEADGLRKSQR
jgi:hypothetical protein